MDRSEDTLELELIELGTITEQTKGPVAPKVDAIGLSYGPGLSND